MYIPELYYAISAFFFPYTLYTDDDKALISPSFEDTAADRGLELDTSTQSCEPKVNVSNKAYHTVHISVVVLGSINRLTKKTLQPLQNQRNFCVRATRFSRL